MKNGTNIFRTSALGRHMYNMMLLKQEAHDILCDIKLDITPTAINEDRRAVHKRKLERFHRKLQHHLFEQMILEEVYIARPILLKKTDTVVSEIRQVLCQAHHRLTWGIADTG